MAFLEGERMGGLFSAAFSGTAVFSCIQVQSGIKTAGLLAKQ